MTHTHQHLSLATLRKRIEDGTVPTQGSASIVAFIDLAKCAIGTDAYYDTEVFASEKAFETVFPTHPDDCFAASFGDASIYGRCRKSILRHAKLAGALQDPYTLLNQLARERKLPCVNRKMIEGLFPGVLLRDVTRDMVLNADRDLRGGKRIAYRSCIGTIDKLRNDPRVVAANILGQDCFGPFPQYRDGDKLRVELPAAFEAARVQLTSTHSKRARRAFELAVDFGLFDKQGPQPEWSLSYEMARKYYAALKEHISDNSAKIYLRALVALLRATVPSSVSDFVNVESIFRLQRPPARVPAKPSKNERRPVVLPAAIDAQVAAYSRDLSLPRRPVNDLRRILQDLLEAGLDIDSPSFFERAISWWKASTDRAGSTLLYYRTVLREFLAYSHRLTAWDATISRAKSVIASGADMQGLLLIKKYAHCENPPLPPEKIDVAVARAFIAKAQSEKKTTKCLAGLAALDALRANYPDLLPGPPIGDQRDWLRSRRGGLPRKLETFLRSELEAAGYSEFSVKEMVSAARRLYNLTTDKTVFEVEPGSVAWRALISTAVERHPREMLIYRTQLQRLAGIVARSWSPGWRELQAKIVHAGIPRASNPVDIMMEVAADQNREPWELDREWAWLHERSLRPDLRQKWSKAVDKFDALREVPEIAASKLLPLQKLGPMPTTGKRLKNAHFPLPRMFEAALIGESKQVLEAAHFVWRCLRKFELYAATSNPPIGELVSEENLQRIMREQPFMSPKSARQHVVRIRDLRESWMGAA